MATYSKQLLSESVNGKSIVITQTGVDTTTIHTTQVSSSILDEVWLYATNSTAADILLVVLCGGTDFSSDVLFEGVIEAYSGNVLICPGLILKGNGTAGSTIYGNASVASGINIFGYVNRIS
jgi:hypothetical protein